MATHGHAHGDHAIPVTHTLGEHHHSGPGHEHEHGSGPSHDFAAANRAYFDEHAHEVEHMHPHAHSLAVKEVEAMRRAWPELFDEERTVAMDYACGTGMVSQQLCQYVKSVVGVDISQASVDRYNTQASNQGLAPEEMHAVCVELTGDPQKNELDGARFDLIVCCASYHHFPSIDDTTRILASFLKPGGSLVVADIKAAEDGHELFPSTHHHLVPHKHGLTEKAIRTAFESAGLQKFECLDGFKAKFRLSGEEVQWFLVRGVKPMEVTAS